MAHCGPLLFTEAINLSVEYYLNLVVRLMLLIKFNHHKSEGVSWAPFDL
jgi:hypothetical protein